MHGFRQQYAFNHEQQQHGDHKIPQRETRPWWYRLRRAASRGRREYILELAPPGGLLGMTCATWIRSTLGRYRFIFHLLSLHTQVFQKYTVSSAHNLCRSQELMEALSGLSVSLTRPCCCNWLRGI